MTTIQAAAVIYAKEFQQLGAFYSSVANLEITQKDETHIAMTSKAFQLVVLQIPENIADSITIECPPQLRENYPIKLVFFVDSMDSARKIIVEHGGDLNSPEQEWEYENHRVCDGTDPEGNIFQLRVPAW